ncbi:hypothetical protein AB0387_28290 [Streptomyces sp. NPDC089173]|uniref:hypothetical protein n=1 Tax=Streptomyces sp. NPDC089173 TaxID=3154965 RepID=UPI00344D5CD8
MGTDLPLLALAALAAVMSTRHPLPQCAYLRRVVRLPTTTRTVVARMKPPGANSRSAPSEESLGRYFTQRPGRRGGVIPATKFGGSMAPFDPNSDGAGRKVIRAGSTPPCEGSAAPTGS